MIKKTIMDKHEARLAVIESKLDEIHKELMGNGRPGILEQWNQLKGSMGTWKFIAGSGGIIGVAALLLTIISRF